MYSPNSPDIPRIDRTHLDTLGSPRTPDLPTVSEESKITDKSASFGGLKTPDLNDSIMECPKTPDFICSEDEMKGCFFFWLLLAIYVKLLFYHLFRFLLCIIELHITA